jgi:hypothetical protein
MTPPTQYCGLSRHRRAAGFVWDLEEHVEMNSVEVRSYSTDASSSVRTTRVWPAQPWHAPMPS